MLGIVRGTLVTAVAGIIGDFSDDSKVKIRRMLNTIGPEFCQLTDWGFLHTTVTFTLSQSTASYSGSGKLPLGFQRFLACKAKDSSGTYYPIDEKSLTWYNELDDPTSEGRPYAVVQNGIDADGYQKVEFYYTPDGTYTFQAECKLGWTDIAEASANDTTRMVITPDCMSALSYYVAHSLGIQQGDSQLVELCERKLYGNRIMGIPGSLDLLILNQRGANKRRRIKPDSSYIDSSEQTISDYGHEI